MVRSNNSKIFQMKKNLNNNKNNSISNSINNKCKGIHYPTNLTMLLGNNNNSNK